MLADQQAVSLNCNTIIRGIIKCPVLLHLPQASSCLQGRGKEPDPGVNEPASDPCSSHQIGTVPHTEQEHAIVT